MKKIFFILLGIGLFSFCSKKENSEKKLLMSEGIYYNDDKTLQLEIFTENNFVRYRLLNEEKKELLRYNENISVFQKWAFYLDHDTLWVFSSDIGNSYWTKDQGRDVYTETLIDHLYDSRNVPVEIFDATRQFFSKD